jgi:hypothetical protein
MRARRAVPAGPPVRSFGRPSIRFLRPHEAMRHTPDPTKAVSRRHAAAARGLLGALLLGTAMPALLRAQGYRADVQAGVSSLELRPLVRDSVPASTVPGDQFLRQLADGTVVTCIPNDYCRWYGSGTVRSLTTLTQEIHLAAWPGIRGLAAHAHLRGWYGSDGEWPLSSHRLEVITAYLSYDVSRFHLQAGRQDRFDALGYRNYDGASARWDGLDFLSAEAYGGWYLAPNLDLPLTSALISNAEPMAVNDRGLVFGGELTGHVGRRVSGSAVYERVIRTDRKALYSERAAFSGQAFLGVGTLDVSGRYDFSFQQVNEFRARLALPLRTGLDVTAQYHHYRPFFPLWTIWGAFNAVGYDGASGSVGLQVPSLGLGLQAGGGYRWYEDSGTSGSNLAGFKDTGWRAFGGANWSSGDWFVDGQYRANIGPGAADMGGDLSVGRRFGEGTWLALKGTSTRSFGEYRLGDQRLSGGELVGSTALGELSLTGSAGFYRLSYTDRPAISDWTQFRMFLGLGYHFGTEPTVDSVLAGLGR